VQECIRGEQEPKRQQTTPPEMYLQKHQRSKNGKWTKGLERSWRGDQKGIYVHTRGLGLTQPLRKCTCKEDIGSKHTRAQLTHTHRHHTHKHTNKHTQTHKRPPPPPPPPPPRAHANTHTRTHARTQHNTQHNTHTHTQTQHKFNLRRKTAAGAPATHPSGSELVNRRAPL